MRVFPQPLPHFKRFLLLVDRNAFPSRSHCHLLLHSQPRGPGHRQWASLLWATGGRGTARRAGPGPAEDTRPLCPGSNGNGPKSFRGTPVYSRVRSQLQARLKMPCSSDTPNSCPHVACTGLHNSGYCRTLFAQFPSALTTAPMRQIALFFNNTETFEHCISASLLVRLSFFSILVRFCFETLSSL